MNKFLTVTKTIDGETGTKQIEVSEITMLAYSRRIKRVIVHTTDNVYYTMGTLTYWRKALNASGFNFMSVDRSNIVNLDCIRVMDDVYKLAYFELNPNSKSKYCTIANDRYPDVIERLEILHPGLTYKLL